MAILNCNALACPQANQWWSQVIPFVSAPQTAWIDDDVSNEDWINYRMVRSHTSAVTPGFKFLKGTRPTKTNSKQSRRRHLGPGRCHPI
jgi:hypothetical protein